MTKQEFMAMSLPHGLKIILSTQNRNYKMNTIYPYSYQLAHDSYKNNAGKVDLCVPILHPLSALVKEIEHNGEKFVPARKLFENGNSTWNEIDSVLIDVQDYVDKIDFWSAMLLIEWHFDIAGLIEKGEAIDVNTLEINPYK